jgi:diguanylate cyclase (GGDEF)-like protein
MLEGLAKLETLKRKNEFEDLRIRDNIRLCKILALALLILDAFLLAVDLALYLPYRKDNSSYFYLYLLHLFIFVFIILWLVVLKRWASPAKAARNKCLFLVFMNTILCWGVLIGLNDLNINGEISVYLITLFGISALVYLTPHEVLLSFSSSMVAFIVGMLLLVPDTRIVISHIINVVISVLLSFVVSRFKFIGFLEEAIRTKELEDVNRQIERAYFELEDTNLRLIHELKERRLAEERIGHLIYYDELTGIFNRKKVMEDISLLLLDKNEKFAVLFVDLDKFKSINDKFGHEAGDTVLKNVAMRLKGIIGEKDIISRIGGDEFIIILRYLESAEQAEKVAQAIVTEMNVVFTLKNRRFLVGASIGISIYPEHGTTADVLINKADLAMYQVKNNGGRGYLLYSEEFDELNVISN